MFMCLNVYVVTHDHVCPYFKAFRVPAVCKTGNNYIPIHFPCENVYPIHYSKGQEIGIRRVVYAIAGGHCLLNINVVVEIIRFYMQVNVYAKLSFPDTMT